MSIEGDTLYLLQ